MTDKLAPLAMVAACGLAACMGSISDPGGEESGSSSGGSGGVVAPGKQSIGLSTGIRRMTREEYNNTVRDLLGDDTEPGNLFPPDEKALGVAVGGTVSSLLAEQYQQAAEGIAERALSNLDALLPCDPASIGEDACATEFIGDFSARAFRRPPTSDELTRLTALYQSGKSQWGFATAIGLLIRATLQSPSFIYVVELPDSTAPGKKVPLSAWELASRLSYFVWSSMPDAELFSLAANGELTKASVLEAQARRMLKDERAKDSVRAFHVHWLDLEGIETISKDPDFYPSFDPAIRTSMRHETERFVEHVVLEDGKLDTLFTANFSFVDDKLAALYGVSAPASDWQKTTLPAGERAGILTHASFLATQAKPNSSSPVYRGKFVREALLCQMLPPPPPDVVIVPPNPDPNATTKEQFAQHSEDPACAGCHQLMDPIGFGFEHYDGIGAWRSEQNSEPIDATGELFETEDVNGPFDGAVQLGQRLASSDQVRDCVARHWFRYAVKRGEADDADSLNAAKSAFEESDWDIRELMVAITLTDGFRYKKSGEN